MKNIFTFLSFRVMLVIAGEFLLLAGLGLGSGGSFRVDLYLRDQIPGTKTFPLDLMVTKRMDEAAKVSLKLQVSAYDAVVDCQASDIEVSGFESGEMEFKPLDKVKVIRFYVELKKPYGEYSVHVELCYDGEKADAGQCFIVEGDRIYTGGDYGACLWGKCQFLLGWGDLKELDVSQQRDILKELQIIQKERYEIIKQRKKSSWTPIFSPGCRGENVDAQVFPYSPSRFE